MNAKPILVFDWPTRAFHALLAIAFAGAWLTAESERWRDIHVALGASVLLLIGFRLVWGLVGTKHARLAALRPSPRRAFAYLRALVAGRPEHHAGHNPAGVLAIIALLALGLATASSGIGTFLDWGGEPLAEVHEALAATMLAVVGVHVAGVIVGSLVHRENLPRAMVTGRKLGAPEEAIGRPRALVAMLLVVLTLGLWTGVVPLPGLDAPRLTDVTASAAARAHHRGDD